MRKFMFTALAAVLCCLLISCNDETKVASASDDQAKKNLDAFHVVSDAFETGDVSGIDSVVASDFVDHTDRGDMGRDSLKAAILAVKKSHTNMKSEVIKELADDEYVFGIIRYTGSSDGSMGMPAGPFDMKSLEVVRFKDGKAVEHWAYMEPREMMKMMEGMKPPADTTKMK